MKCPERRTTRSSPHEPKPGTLTAVQVILSIQAVLVILLQLVAMFGLGIFGLGILLDLALSAFKIYVVVAINQGGHRPQNLVRVVVGISFAFALLSLLLGLTIPLAFVVALLVTGAILALNESTSAKEWYEETQNPQPYQSH
ncbi:hypothetical protein GCM10009603_42600 [Nocardiopsis exhalans]